MGFDGIGGGDYDSMFQTSQSGGAMFSNGLGMVSPLLQPMAEKLHLDESLMAMLVGGYDTTGHLRGARGAPTQHFDVMYNAWQRQALRPVVAGQQAQFKAAQQVQLSYFQGFIRLEGRVRRVVVIGDQGGRAAIF